MHDQTVSNIKRLNGKSEPSNNNWTSQNDALHRSISTCGKNFDAQDFAVYNLNYNQ